MIRIGIICPSEIALRRFLPALKKAGDKFSFVGVAIASPEEWFGDISKVAEEKIDSLQSKEYDKASAFRGKIFKGYESIIKHDEIDAIYIPLPPALHYRWAKLALENDKHVFVEKPSTCYLKDIENLINIARKKGLALHENYMFVFHNQIKELNDIIAAGKQVGTPRIYRISFGFPRRALTDFRYKRELGGGALLDAGGYTLRYATILLGATARVIAAQANYEPDIEVDIFGSATMVNNNGMTAQLAFGMDNDYRCEIEVWGSKGTLISGRILTAPVGFVPKYTLKKNHEYTDHDFSEDDAFLKSINRFAECVDDVLVREDNYSIIIKQAQMLQQFREISGLK